MQKYLEVGVKAFIVNNSNHYLVLLRNKPYIGEEKPRWDIPGGRINPGEPLHEALAREITEETGLQLKEIKQILDAQDILRDPAKHVVRITFLAECNGTVKLNGEEHSEYKWATLDELKSLHLDKFAVPVIDQLIDLKLEDET